MAAPSARRLFDALVRAGVTHLVGLPDNGSAPLFALAERQSSLTSLLVTREGEAFALASGLWLGGARPAVAIQNTGLLESGDALRGTVLRMGTPLLVLVGYRGAARTPEQLGMSDDLAALRDAAVDSVAVLTEPTLKAWRIPYEDIRENADVELVGVAWRQAQAQQRPVALLLHRGLT